MSKTQAQHQKDQYRKQQARINKLREERDEARTRVAELEAENKLLRNTLVSKALPDGETAQRKEGGA